MFCRLQSWLFSYIYIYIQKSMYTRVVAAASSRCIWFSLCVCVCAYWIKLLPGPIVVWYSAARRIPYSNIKRNPYNERFIFLLMLKHFRLNNHIGFFPLLFDIALLLFFHRVLRQNHATSSNNWEMKSVFSFGHLLMLGAVQIWSPASFQQIKGQRMKAGTQFSSI